jgi:HAD superfamily hydrolase (TIGR01509 family)
MVIKAIIFDCFGVLVMARRVKLYQDYPQFKTQIDDLGYQSDYGMTSRQQFDDSIAELVGLTPEEVEARYWATNVRNEAAIAWVRELKSSGQYKIGMLSNIGRGFINDSLPMTEQTSLFDEVVLSCDVGMIKPDPRIFELAAERLGVAPYECIMIDDLPSNIDGAERAGMQGVVFGSINQAQADFKQLLGPTRA